MSIPIEEQETTVAAGRSADHVLIYTTNTTHLKRLRAHESVAELKGGEDWGQFEVPNAVYDPLTGFRRRRNKMTEEQRQAASERLAKARAKRGK